MRLYTRPGVARERREDLELDVGEPDRLAAQATRALLEVDLQVAVLERLLEPVLRLRERGAPQHRLHPAAELAHRERLGDVVVGAELEAEHLVDLLGPRGEHDDRDRAARPDLAAHLEAVHPREHQVEHDQVEVVLAQAVERLLAVEGGHHVVALLAQRIGEQRLDRLLVVHEKDARGRACSTFQIVG